MKLRTKILAIILGVIIGISGALVLEWYLKRRDD